MRRLRLGPCCLGAGPAEGTENRPQNPDAKSQTHPQNWGMTFTGAKPLVHSGDASVCSAGADER